MTLRHDESQYFALKSAIEGLLGREAWRDLKECTEVAKWRRYFLKLIEAIRVSIEASIEICDQDWRDNIRENLDRGTSGVKASKSIEDLLSSFTATLLRQTFLQIGQLPDRPTADKVDLSRENWRLCDHRSVQYVQNPAQVEAVFWHRQQASIGFSAQITLRNRHRHSRSKLPFHNGAGTADWNQVPPANEARPG